MRCKTAIHIVNNASSSLLLAKMFDELLLATVASIVFSAASFYAISFQARRADMNCLLWAAALGGQALLAVCFGSEVQPLFSLLAGKLRPLLACLRA